MEQRVSLITLGVRDMDRVAAFYEALGWSRVESPDGVKTNAWLCAEFQY